MQSEQGVQASFWLMILLTTIGSVDMPGHGNRKLPAPRSYVVVVVAWSALFLLVDAGKARAAAGAGWLLVLAGTVLGPFGKNAVSFLNAVSSQFAVKPPAAAATAPATGNQTV